MRDMADATDARIESREDTIRNNVETAIAVADLVRPTLGPKGGDVALLEMDGGVTCTNDGATILRNTTVHPDAISAKMIINVAKTQEAKAFDGTTSCVVLSGELLKKALNLVEDGVHPASVEEGFNLAAVKAIEHLDSITLTSPALEHIASTAMTGKSAAGHKDVLADLAIKAATRVEHPSDINIVVRPGAPVSDSFFTNGVIVDKQGMTAIMPKEVANPRIALYECELSIPNMVQGVSVAFNDGAQAEAYMDSRNEKLKLMASHILDSTANVVLCLKDVDPAIADILGKNGVLLARRVAASDLEAVAQATGAMIVSEPLGLESEDLGTCGYVAQRKYDLSPRPLLFFEDCDDDNVSSLMLFSPTEDTAYEIGRAMDDTVGVCWLAHKSQHMLAGGGSAYMSMSSAVKNYAETVSGRAQLAVKAFADALEIIPKTLAENAGLSPVDALIDLRAAHSAGETGAYVDINTGEVVTTEHVVEPLSVVSVAVETAASTAVSVIRIVRNVRAKIPDDPLDRM